MNLPSHAFEELLVAAKYSIILPDGDMADSTRSLFLISSSTHSYQPTIILWADITGRCSSMSVRRRGVVGVMTR